MHNITTLWSQFNISLALVIFIAYLIIDALYVYYTYSIVKKHPASAASSGFIIHILLAVGVVNYVENFLYVIPLACGSWCGTYLVVLREKSKIV
jgi:hypothetical protein